MKKEKVTELLELDKDRKWSYLGHYYKAATAFYDVKDQVVSDGEIQECIRKFKEKPLPRIRMEIPLKEWKFILDEKVEGVALGYYSEGYDESNWEEVSVPHSCRYIPENPVIFGKSCDPIYVMPKDSGFTVWRGDYSTWYKKRLKLDRIRENSISYLRFDSINLISSVWVNDVPMMMDHYGLYPYELEITEELVSRNPEDIVISVKADNIASNTPVMFSIGLQTAYVNPSFPQQDGRIWYMHDDVFSGMAGDAVLSVRNRNHIDNAFFVTESISEKKADIKCSISFRNTSWQRFVGKVRIEIKKWTPEEGPSIESVYQDVNTLPMSEMQTTIRFCLQNAEYWSVDTPNLYLAHIILEDEDGAEIDDIFESFGIRTIKVEGNKLYLNNRRITPRGSHDSSHYHGESMICPSDNIIVKDILLHKKMGAICSRWPSDSKIHYKKIAEYCDQLGYMVSWCGYFEMWQIHPQAELYATRDVKAIIRSLKNSPSIIFWEMGDEPYFLTHEYKRMKWYELMYRLVTEEDTSRPVIPSGHWCADLVKRIADYREENFSIEEQRAKILEELPVYNAELAIWDFHFVPGGNLMPDTSYYFVDRIKDSLGGQKFTVFTEFGTDGLPDPEKVKDIYNGFKWFTSPYLPNIKKNADLGYYGKEIEQEDWKETQACQAIVLSNLICYLRESPEEIGAYYFLTMFDWSTFYFGLIDASGNCKLAYFVVQDCYRPVYVSGLHGNTVLKSDDIIAITVCNLGEAAEDAKLKAVIKDVNFRIVQEECFSIDKIEGNSAVTKIAELNIVDISPGLFSIEYHLNNIKDEEIAKGIEVFFIEG